MLQLLFDPPARLWLLAGKKYEFSKSLAGADWDVPVHEALKAHGLSIEGVKTLENAMAVFRNRWHWTPDPLLQLWDVVYPPVQLLARGGDDCDGWAMAHAQAAEYVLGPQGWKAVIVSYYADPWPLSHHFAVAIDPAGNHWVLQPQPTKDQEPDLQTVYGPYPDLKTCADVVASWYAAKASWYDVRDSRFEALAA